MRDARRLQVVAFADAVGDPLEGLRLGLAVVLGHEQPRRGRRRGGAVPELDQTRPGRYLERVVRLEQLRDGVVGLGLLAVRRQDDLVAVAGQTLAVGPGAQVLDRVTPRIGQRNQDGDLPRTHVAAILSWFMSRGQPTA